MASGEGEGEGGIYVLVLDGLGGLRTDGSISPSPGPTMSDRSTVFDA